MSFDAAGTLAELLTVARQSGCGCPVCTELRAMWVHLDLDVAVTDQRGEIPRPASVCGACWTSEALAPVREGRAGLGSISAAGHCLVCGMPTVV